MSDGKLFKKYPTIWAFAGGCVLGNREKAGTESFRWVDVADLYQNVVKILPNGTIQYVIKFELVDKRAIEVIGASTAVQTSKIKDFLPVASAFVTHCQLPAMRGKLDAGGELVFGGTFLRSDGLFRPSLFGKGKLLPWAEIAGAGIDDGYVKVVARGAGKAWGSWSAALFPNADAFIALIGERAAGTVT